MWNVHKRLRWSSPYFRRQFSQSIFDLTTSINFCDKKRGKRGLLWYGLGPGLNFSAAHITWVGCRGREGLCQYLQTFYWSFIFILCEIVNELEERDEEGWAEKSKQTIGRKKEVNIQMDDKRKAKAVSVPWKSCPFRDSSTFWGEQSEFGPRRRVPGIQRSIEIGRPGSLCSWWMEWGTQSSKVKNDGSGLCD